MIFSESGVLPIPWWPMLPCIECKLVASGFLTFAVRRSERASALKKNP